MKWQEKMPITSSQGLRGHFKMFVWPTVQNPHIQFTMLKKRAICKSSFERVRVYVFSHQLIKRLIDWSKLLVIKFLVVNKLINCYSFKWQFSTAGHNLIVLQDVRFDNQPSLPTNNKWHHANQTSHFFKILSILMKRFIGPSLPRTTRLCSLYQAV